VLTERVHQRNHKGKKIAENQISPLLHTVGGAVLTLVGSASELSSSALWGNSGMSTVYETITEEILKHD